MITALAKKAGKYDVERELKSRASQFEGLEFIIDPNYALDLSYKINAILKLVLQALSVGLVIAGIKIANAGKTVNKYFVWIYTWALIVFLVILLKTII